MTKKLYPWLRVLIIVTSLVLGQAQMAVTTYAATPEVENMDAANSRVISDSDAPDIEEPLGNLDVPLQEFEKEACKVGVGGFAVQTVPASPNPSLPDWGTTKASAYYYPESAYTTVTDANARTVGQTIRIFVGLQNTSAGCPTGATTLNSVQATIYLRLQTPGTAGPPTELEPEIVVPPITIPSAGLDFHWPNPASPGTLTSGQGAWVAFDFTLPATLSGDLHIRTMARADAVDDPSAFADVIDFDDSYVRVVGPGFQQVSFDPDQPAAPAGTEVTFKLTIRNSREGTFIRGLGLTSPNASFAAQCNDWGTEWERVGTVFGDPRELAYNEEAECSATVTIPTDPAPDSLSLSGQLTVTDGANGMTAAVQSTPVMVSLPKVAVTKSVWRIDRGTTTIYNWDVNPNDPIPQIAPGDVITYRIVVKNSGMVTLNNIFVVDSLIGTIPVSSGAELLADAELVMPNTRTRYTVLPGGQDPLVNTVRVTAMGKNTAVQVSAQAATSLDVIDSALLVEFTAEDPATGIVINEDDGVERGQQIRYRLILRNLGQVTLSNLTYVPLTPPQTTVGDEQALNVASLAPGQSSPPMTWLYTVTDTDPDPLTSTVRVRGATPAPDNLLVYGIDTVILNISNPNIEISNVVTEPVTPTVLRGGKVVYDVTVTNTNDASDACNVVVDQYLRDPISLGETLIQANVPLAWADPASPGRIYREGHPTFVNEATALVTYLVDGSSPDPLEMIFEVRAVDCTNPDLELTDRTLRTLDLSDAQINAAIQPQFGSDGVAVVGDNLEFVYTATNVGAVTLTQLSAEYCIKARAGDTPLVHCYEPTTHITRFTLNREDTLSSFQETFGTFNYTIQPGDEDLRPFLVEVTLFGKDNQGNDVSIKTAYDLSIATDALQVALNGPTNAVEKDMETYGALIRNQTGGNLSNLLVYRVFEDGSRVLLANRIEPLADLAVWTPILPPQEILQTGLVDGNPVMSLRIQVEATRPDSVVVIANAKLDIAIIPMVKVVKTLTSGVPIAGQSLTFNIRILNQSRQQTLTLTHVDDPVLDLPSYTVPYGLTDFDTDLAPGEFTEAEFTIASVNELPNPLINTFTADGTRSSDGAGVSGFGSVKVDLQCPIDIVFNVFNEDSPDADWVMGESLTWTITLSNRGGVPIEGINVTDSLIHNGPVNPAAINWPTATAGYIGVGQSAEYHSAPKLITSLDYSPSGAAEITDQVRIVFEQDGESSACDKSYTQPLNSPVMPIKTADKSIAFTGETVKYEFALLNVTEADDSPYDIFFVQSVTDSLLSPQIILCDFNKDLAYSDYETSGYIYPGDFIQCETERTRDIQPSDPKELVNTMRIEFDDPGDFVDYVWATSEVKINTSTPFALIKTANVDEVAAGDTILYDYRIVNISMYPITNIELVDDKVGNLIPTFNGGQRLNMLPGTAFNLPSIPYEVKPSDADPLVNIVTITGTASYGGQTRQVTQSITETVDIIDSELVVTKSAHASIAPPTIADQVLLPGVSPVGPPLPDDLPVTGADGMPEANVGQPVYYCFRVENTGEGTSFVSDITIVDPVFPNLQTLFQNALVAKYPGNGAPNQLFGDQFVAFCAYRGGLNTSMGDPVINVAVVEGLSSTAVPLYQEDELRIDLQGSDLLATKTASRTVAFVGDTITYRIVITNRNESFAIDDIVITDAFGVGTPQNLTAQCDWSTGGYAADPVTGFPAGRLALGGYATCTYTYEVQPNDPAALINTVVATGTLQDGLDTLVEDRTQSSVAITASQLLVRKTALSSIALPEDVVTYQVTITNIGQTPVKNLLVVDRHYGTTQEYPSGVAGQTYKVDINPYETVFMTFTLTMPTAAELATPAMADRDPYFNEVSVYGTIFDQDGNPIYNTDPEETDPYLNGSGPRWSIKATDTESVDIINPNLRVLKTPSVLAAMPGTPVDYTINITNVGKDRMTNLSVDDLEDALPAIDVDDRCPGVGCIFTYAPGLVDADGNPSTPLQANPRAGMQYDEQFHLDPANAATMGAYPGLLGGLLPNERLIGTITVTVPIGFSDAQFQNVVAVRGVAASITVSDRAAATIDVRDAGILVEKAANTSLVAVGAKVGYAVTVTNVGAVSFDRIVISDKGIDPFNLDGDNNPDTLIVTAGFPVSQAGGAETLDANEIYVANYEYTILPTDADPYINRATVRGYNDLTGEQAVNVAQAVVDVQNAEIAIEKYGCVGALTDYPGAASCVTAANVSDGTPDVITYFVRVRNTGMVTIENLAVNDTLFAAPLGITWPMPNNGLAPNDGVDGSGSDELWFAYQYTVQTGDLDPLRNIATVSGSTPAPAGVPVRDSAIAQIRLVSGDLLLEKTASAETALVGENVYYTFTVTNLSTTDDITGIQIFDPAVTGSSAEVCTLPAAANPLEPGEVATCTSPVRAVLQSDPRPFVNLATARGTQNSLTVTATATHTLQILTSGVSVTKVANVEVAAVGDTVTYLYEVTNTGTAAIDGLAVIDSDSAVMSDPAWVWPTTLLAGETQRVSIQRTILPTDPDPYTNTVRVTGRINGVAFTQTATETVFISNTDLVVENTPSTLYATPGQNVTFTYRLRNLGTEDLLITGATDDLCTLALPPVSLMDQITDNPKVLAVGASLTLFCTQPAPAVGPMVSLLRVDATGQTSGAAVSDTASAQVAITTGGVLLTKTADRVAAQPGDVITYTITVTNVGTQPLQNFVFSDPMLSNPLPLPPASLAVGGSFTITGTYTVSVADQVVTNTASITATGATTPTQYTDTDTVSVGVISDPSATLLLTKTTTATTGQPGQNVTYTLQVRNISANTVGTAGDAIQLYDNGVLVATIPSLGPAGVFTANHVATIPADITTATYINPAWVVMQSGGDHIDDASATLPLTLVTINKTTAEPVTGPGRVITYNYAVTNLSTADLLGVTLLDSMESSTVFTDFAWVTPLGTIPGSGVANASATITVPGSMLAASTISNTVEARLLGRTVGTGQADVENEGALALIPTKTADKASYAPGETIVYTITVANPNKIEIPSVTITDSDPLMVWNSPDPSLGVTIPACADTTPADGLCDDPTAPVATFTGTRSAPLVFTLSSLSNTATMTAAGMADVTADVTVTILAATPLTMNKVITEVDGVPYVGGSEVLPGQEITYTISVTNPNVIAIPNVIITDTLITWGAPNPSLAPGVTIPACVDAAPADGACDNPLATVATFTGTAIAPLVFADTVLSNTASMTINGVPHFTTDPATDVTVSAAELTITKTVNPSGTVVPGTVLTYTIEVNNPTQADVPGVTITDVFNPTGITEPAWTTALPVDGTLPPGITTFTGTTVAPLVFVETTFANTATMTVTGMAAPVTDDASVTVSALRPLNINKRATVSEVVGGATVTYIMTVSNPNSVAVPGVTLADDTMPGLTWTPSLPVNMSVLPGNTSYSARWVVPLTQPTGLVTNTATLVVAGAPAYNDSSQAIVNVAAFNPVIEIEVSGDPNPPILGIPITYTVTIRNVGNVPVSGLSGTWTLTPTGGSATSPANLTLAATTLAVGAETTATFTRTEDQTGPYTITATGRFTTPAGVAPVTGSALFTPVQESTDLRAEIVGIWQSTGTAGVMINGLRGEPLQTGEPIFVAARLVNLSSAPITVEQPTALMNVGGPSGLICLPSVQVTSTAWPITLAGGQSTDDLSLSLGFTCTPPASTPGQPQVSYLLPNGLARMITVSAFSSTGQATARQNVTLVDLALDVQLEVLDADTGEIVTEAETGAEVVFRVTLINVGASRLGCTPIETAALPWANPPCRFHLVGGVWFGGDTDTDPIASDNFTEWLASATTTGAVTVGDVVLAPSGSAGAAAIFLTEPVTLDTMEDITFGVMAEGGFFSLALSQLNPTLLSEYTTFDVSETTVEMTGVELSLSINVNPNPSVLGQGVTYTFTVNNLPSGVPVTGLKGTYQLVTSSASVPQDGIVLAGMRQQEPVSGTLSFTTTSLTPGQSVSTTVSRVESFTGTYIVSASIQVDGMAATEFVTANRVVSPQVTGITPTPLGGASTGTPVVEKSADVDAAQPGDVITWTVVVRNSGTGTMEAVMMQDAVPAGLEITSASTTLGALTRDAQTVKLNIPSLVSGGSAVVTIVTTVSQDMTGPADIKNTACALRSGGTQACADATVSLGPDVEGLPLTGQRLVTTDGGWNGLGLLIMVLLSSLALMMTAQTGSRRTLLAAAVLLVVLAVLVVVVMLTLLGGNDKAEPTKEAFEPPATDASVTVGPETPASPQTPQPTVGEATGPDVVFQFPPTPTPYVMPTPAGLRQLMIPKLGDQFSVPIPIVQLPIVNREWDVSGLGHYVGWLQGTTWLDSEWGNTVLAAHVQLGTANPGPFWGLSQLVPGDEIVVMEGDVERVYVVTSTRKVSPDDWTVTAPTQSPVLTLITCTEWDQAGGIFSQRMVVQAVPAVHTSIES